MSDLVLLITPGLIWGASFLFIAQGLEAMGPSGVTFTRILIGFLTLSFVPKVRQKIPKSAWPKIALLGILWMAFPLSMFPFAEQHVSSALTGVLNGAVPIFTATVACFVARKLPSRAMVFGLTVGFIGTVLIALPSFSDGHSSITGVLMILAAVVSYGFVLNIARPLQHEFGALPVIWRAQLVALVLTAPLGLPELLNAHWTPVPFMAMLALGALGTGMAFVIMTIAAGKLGPMKASATTYLMPGVALVLGVLVRGEKIAVLSIVGGVICVAGALLVRRVSMKEQEVRS